MPIQEARPSLIGCLLWLCAGLPVVMNAQVVITLDSTTRHQTITGWEAVAWAAQGSSPLVSEYSPAFPRYKDALYDTVIHDLGITRLRVEVRSGAETDLDNWLLYQNAQIDYATWRARRYATVNDNADPFTINWSGFKFTELDSIMEQVVLPLKQRLESRGTHLEINLNYVAFTSQITGGGQYIHSDTSEYAEFVLATYLHLQNRYGVVPDLWEPFLEPDNIAQWNHGTRIAAALLAAGARLSAHGFTPRFVAPSTTHMGNAVTYFDDMLLIPGALQHVVEVSYHRYGGVSDANLQAIAARAVQHNLNTSMLEWWSTGNGYQILHKDLAMGRNSAWQQGVLCSLNPASPGASLCAVDASDSLNPVVTVSPMTRFTRQYTKYVEPGAVRIGTSSSGGTIEPLAFVHPDGRPVVVVKASAPGAFAIQGLPAGTYGITYTTNAEFGVSLPGVILSAGGNLNSNIPAAGVLTVFARSTPTHAPTDGGSAPMDFALAQNFPNPFNPTTVIRFSLPTRTHVLLAVYDLLGHEVARLVDEVRSPGLASVPFDGDHLSSGVYLYRLSAGSQTQTRRMILIR